MVFIEGVGLIVSQLDKSVHCIHILILEFHCWPDGHWMHVPVFTSHIGVAGGQMAIIPNYPVGWQLFFYGTYICPVGHTGVGVGFIGFGFGVGIPPVHWFVLAS